MTSITTGRARPLAAAAVAVLALTVSGCSGSESADQAGSSGALSARDADAPAPAAAPDDAGSYEATSSDLLASAGGGTVDKATADAGPDAGPDAGLARSVIANGELEVASKDPERARRDALAVVRALRGHVADEQSSSDDDGRVEQVDLTLRVPSASFEQALDRLGDIGTVRHRSQSAEDVTTQVIDVQARVRAQTASVASIRRLLARATTIGQVMSIERELADRQAALDALTGKQKWLADQTSLATVHLGIVRPEHRDTEEAGGFLGGLEDGWHALGDSAAAVARVAGAVLPFAAVLAVLGVPLWLLRRAGRLRARGRSAA
jgi:hypothetical protein